MLFFLNILFCITIPDCDHTECYKQMEGIIHFIGAIMDVDNIICSHLVSRKKNC